MSASRSSNVPSRSPACRLVPFTPRCPDQDLAKLIMLWRQLPKLQQVCVLHLCRRLREPIATSVLPEASIASRPNIVPLGNKMQALAILHPLGMLDVEKLVDRLLIDMTAGGAR